MDSDYTDKLPETDFDNFEDDCLVIGGGKISYQEENIELETEELKPEIDYINLYKSLQKNIRQEGLDLLTVKSDFEIYCSFVQLIDDYYL